MSDSSLIFSFSAADSLINLSFSFLAFSWATIKAIWDSTSIASSVLLCFSFAIMRSSSSFLAFSSASFLEISSFLAFSSASYLAFCSSERTLVMCVNCSLKSLFSLLKTSIFSFNSSFSFLRVSISLSGSSPVSAPESMINAISTTTIVMKIEREISNIWFNKIFVKFSQKLLYIFFVVGKKERNTKLEWKYFFKEN